MVTQDFCCLESCKIVCKVRQQAWFEWLAQRPFDLSDLACSCYRTEPECDWSFSVFLRSKRKMLGRRDTEDEGQRISSSSSSSSPPVTPTDPLPCQTRPASFKSQRSGRSENFKALVLRKGSRSDTYSRISAVERLRIVGSPTTAADHQSALSPPPDQVKATTDTCDINAHLTLDVPVSPTSPCTQNFSMMFRWRQRDQMHSHLLLTSSSSSPFFFLSSPSMRPRSLTPPCSASRRFAARCRLYAAPMTAIFEVESEEEDGEADNEVFVESPGTERELSQRLVETS